MVFSFGDLSFPALIFYFTIYSFIGWILENSFSFATGRAFFKDNFLKGPFKPMYGFAPVFLLLIITPKMPISMVLFFCFLIPTLVEYVTGIILTKLFHHRYWDYSNQRWQLHGHICLNFCIVWVVLAYLGLRFVQPFVSFLYENIEPFWLWFYPTVCGYYLLDLCFALRRHGIKVLSKKKPTTV